MMLLLLLLFQSRDHHSLSLSLLPMPRLLQSLYRNPYLMFFRHSFLRSLLLMCLLHLPVFSSHRNHHRCRLLASLHHCPKTPPPPPTQPSAQLSQSSQSTQFSQSLQTTQSTQSPLSPLESPCLSIPLSHAPSLLSGIISVYPTASDLRLTAVAHWQRSTASGQAVAAMENLKDPGPTVSLRPSQIPVRPPPPRPASKGKPARLDFTYGPPARKPISPMPVSSGIEQPTTVTFLSSKILSLNSRGFSKRFQGDLIDSLCSCSCFQETQILILRLCGVFSCAWRGPCFWFPSVGKQGGVLTCFSESFPGNVSRWKRDTSGRVVGLLSKLDGLRIKRKCFSKICMNTYYLLMS